MQNVDVTQFTNDTGYKVIHDPEDNLFYIKNNNGNKRPGKFTSRIFAEKSLYDYLELLTNNVKAKAVRDSVRNPPKKSAGRPPGPMKTVLTPGKDRKKSN